MAKIIVILYDDPVDGYPKIYARDAIPEIKSYPGGQTAPTPQAIDFKPGELLGSVSGALGLKKWAADNGHKLVVTPDKEGANSTLDRELPDAEVVISQPFWPAYDGGAVRQGTEVEADHNRRHRLRSHRPRSR